METSEKLEQRRLFKTVTFETAIPEYNGLNTMSVIFHIFGVVNFIGATITLFLVGSDAPIKNTGLNFIDIVVMVSTVISLY